MTATRKLPAMFRRKHSWGECDGLPDEATVLADIDYFESRIRTLLDGPGEGSSARDTATLQVYRLLLRQRHQLLAALRDGVPDRWPEYAAGKGSASD